MQGNPRIVTLLSALAAREIGYRTLWSAKRSPESPYDDVFFVTFTGKARTRTAVLIDYGPQNGYGLFPEAAGLTYTSDVRLIERGANGIELLMDEVAEFHRATEMPINSFPILPDEAKQRGKDMLLEEAKETADAIDAGDLVETADGLIDTIYIAIGRLLEFGIPGGKVWDEVHASNMAKVDPATGRVRKRADGKVLKPEGWVAPDVAGIIERALP